METIIPILLALLLKYGVAAYFVQKESKKAKLRPKQLKAKTTIIHQEPVELLNM